VVTHIADNLCETRFTEILVFEFFCASPTQGIIAQATFVVFRHEFPTTTHVVGLFFLGRWRVRRLSLSLQYFFNLPWIVAYFAIGHEVLFPPPCKTLHVCHSKILQPARQAASVTPVHWDVLRVTECLHLLHSNNVVVKLIGTASFLQFFVKQFVRKNWFMGFAQYFQLEISKFKAVRAGCLRNSSLLSNSFKTRTAELLSGGVEI
jgi:hypothetical protein